MTPSPPSPLPLGQFHAGLGARFGQVNGCPIAAHYGDSQAEYHRLRQSAGLIDLSCRGRLCLAGADRQRFLNGQVTNNVKSLAVGQGCYAALVSAKGKMQSDLNIYQLPDELLLDFEPGLGESVTRRLEGYVIADDVQILDASPHYGLLSIQGPAAAAALPGLGLGLDWTPPGQPRQFTVIKDPGAGDVYCMNLPRGTAAGFDLFVPSAALEAIARRALDALAKLGGGPCGWDALEVCRVESGIPRFGPGADIDESNLAPEALDTRAISYDKGCYIGQEVIARIRTYGQVAKSLKGIKFQPSAAEPPRHGDKVIHGGREAGCVTSAVRSPRFQGVIALAYVRREHNQPGTEVTVRTAAGELAGTVVDLPFAS